MSAEQCDRRILERAHTIISILAIILAPAGTWVVTQAVHGEEIKHIRTTVISLDSRVASLETERLRLIEVTTALKMSVDSLSREIERIRAGREGRQ